MSEDFEQGGVRDSLSWIVQMEDMLMAMRLRGWLKRDALTMTGFLMIKLIWYRVSRLR